MWRTQLLIAGNHRRTRNELQRPTSKERRVIGAPAMNSNDDGVAIGTAKPRWWRHRASLWTLLILVACAMLLTWVPARHSRVEVRAGTLRVGLVFDVGGRGDKSFNDAAYEGLERARKELGVEGIFLEPSGAEDREAALRLFAARGYDLVFGVGFIFSSDIDTVARDYPNVRFACIDYSPSPAGVPENVAALAFREEEGSYLVGGVAGFLSTSKHVGFVGGMTGPLIKKFEAGYVAGVRYACPTCQVHVVRPLMRIATLQRESRLHWAKSHSVQMSSIMPLAPPGTGSLKRQKMPEFLQSVLIPISTMRCLVWSLPAW
jgi:hypothetical protein